MQKTQIPKIVGKFSSKNILNECNGYPEIAETSSWVRPCAVKLNSITISPSRSRFMSGELYQKHVNGRELQSPEQVFFLILYIITLTLTQEEISVDVVVHLYPWFNFIFLSCIQEKLHFKLKVKIKPQCYFYFVRWNSFSNSLLA